MFVTAFAPLPLESSPASLELDPRKAEKTA